MKTLAHANRAGVGDTPGVFRFSNNERRLKVLVLDEEIPYPPNSGKRIRTWNLLQRLAKRHSISLLCYGEAGDPAVEAARRAGIRTHLVKPKANPTGWQLYLGLFLNLFSTRPFSVTKHYSRRFHRKFRALLAQESWDLVQCEWTPYARFISRGCRTPVLIATHNVESQIWERRGQNARDPISKAFFWTQERKMRWFEARALLRASSVAAVTRGDVETMRDWGVENVTPVPNGVDLESSIPAPEAERDGEILAMASLDWYPNVDALHYFVREILPLLSVGGSEIRLRIVGRRPSESLKQQLSSNPAVDFTGEVGDVTPYLAQAAVFVVPLRIGGGSRIKILEALAAGKAVVSTSIGAEGLDVIHGKHLLIADSPSEFARCVDKLLASKELRRQLGEEGRKLVTDFYGWDGIAAQLEAAWLRTSLHHASAAPVCSTQKEVHAIS
jgi:polysaccharide biosynthesis protein PslH